MEAVQITSNDGIDPDQKQVQLKEKQKGFFKNMTKKQKLAFLFLGLIVISSICIIIAVLVVPKPVQVVEIRIMNKGKSYQDDLEIDYSNYRMEIKNPNKKEEEINSIVNILETTKDKSECFTFTGANENYLSINSCANQGLVENINLGLDFDKLFEDEFKSLSKERNLQVSDKDQEDKKEIIDEETKKQIYEEMLQNSVLILNQQNFDVVLVSLNHQDEDQESQDEINTGQEGADKFSLNLNQLQSDSLTQLATILNTKPSHKVNYEYSNLEANSENVGNQLRNRIRRRLGLFSSVTNFVNNVQQTVQNTVQISQNTLQVIGGGVGLAVGAIVSQGYDDLLIQGMEKGTQIVSDLSDQINKPLPPQYCTLRKQAKGWFSHICTFSVPLIQKPNNTNPGKPKWRKPVIIFRK